MRASQTQSKSRLLLFELLLVILFFALSSAVCVRLFVYAHRQSAKSEELTMAVLKAQDAAECIRATDRPYDGLKQYLGAGEDLLGRPVFYYDDQWNPSGPDYFTYKMSVRQDEAQKNILACLITVTKGSAAGEEKIYDLTIQKYVPASS